ncbi:MAG: hypothetical protein P8Z41_13245 [Anaerolineales bacterium]
MTSRARVVVALFTVSILGAFITGRDLFYNLVYLWGFLLVSSYTWARLTLLGVRLEREAFSTRAQVGQLFTERFTLVNESRIPKIWIDYDQPRVTSSSNLDPTYGVYTARTL